MKQVWQPTLWVERIKERWMAVLALAVVMVMTGAIGWAVKPESHDIVVLGLGSTQRFRTTQQEVGLALQSGGIKVGPKDVVSPAINSSLQGKQEVTVQIRRAVTATVLADGKAMQVLSAAPTVGNLLAEAGITLQPKDTVSVDLAAAPTAGLEIKVARYSQKVVTTQVEVPFDTVRREDPSINAGQTRELQAGSPGLKEVTQVVYLQDGKEVKTETVEERVVREPVSSIVAYGTGGVVSRGGRDYRYTKELDLSSTGYTAGKESNPNGTGYTYTGMRAQYGVVAVDPRVIPLYTRLYIDGYGPAIAADIGGDIKGNRIDLCFDSLSEALEWGRRPVKVYILGD
ncbi:MAG: G5 domain-containing protein [Mycobacterium leprae]